MFRFELGSTLKDTITGFKGVVIARTEWLYGCKRYALTPTKLHDSKPIESLWVDEPQLEEIPTKKKRTTAQILITNRDKYGPRNDPKR